MKKIIYIFLLGLVFVACDKNDIGDSDIQVAVSEVQALDIDNNTKFADAFEFINNLVDSKGILVEDNSSESARGAGDAGPNWLQIIFFEVDSTHVAFLRSDVQGEACPNGASNVTNTLYTLTDTHLIVEIDGESISYQVPVATYTAAFASNGPDGVIVVNAERTAATAGTHNVIVTTS